MALIFFCTAMFNRSVNLHLVFCSVKTELFLSSLEGHASHLEVRRYRLYTNIEVEYVFGCHAKER